MPDATMTDFGELAACVIRAEYPILPKPHWGQDAAYIAFVIDGLRREYLRLRAEVAEVAAHGGTDEIWTRQLTCILEPPRRGGSR